MTYLEFKAIVEDIESNLEGGEGYCIHVYTSDARRFEGSWQWLPTTVVGADGKVIIISKYDHPPWYIPLSSIVSIQLSSR